MANRYDIIYRGKDVERLNYRHEGQRWGYYAFVRGGEMEADHMVGQLQAQGYEAKRVFAGVPRTRDLDD
jgi:hypothetical protein